MANAYWLFFGIIATTPMTMVVVMDMANGYGYAQLRHTVI